MDEKISEKNAADKTSDNSKFQQLRRYDDIVYNYLMEGMYQAEIIRQLRKQGYQGSKSNAEYYVKSLREKYGIVVKKISKKESAKDGLRIGKKRMSQKEILDCIWNGEGFSAEERDILIQTHPVLLSLEKCVKNFKKIFEEKSMPLLYLFIDGYLHSPIKKMAAFAKSLLSDIDAVENAVASEKSNGFVEGTNNRIKMIKRTMYGRCGLPLLSAKLMLRL